MSLPNPNFQPGDAFTADNANGIIEAILIRIQGNSFDLASQNGNQTLLSYAVPSDTDQLIRADTCGLVHTLAGSNSILWRLLFIDTDDNSSELLIENAQSLGFYPNSSFTIKAKRGTTVTIDAVADDGNIYDFGGALLILKSVV